VTEPYKPPRRDPLQARLDNLLLTRQASWSVTFGPHAVTVDAVVEAFPRTSWAASLFFQAGGLVWRVDLGDMAFLRTHPALAGTPEDMELPEPLESAMLDVFLSPMRPMLEALLGATIKLHELRRDLPDEKSHAAHVHLRLTFPDANILTLRVGIPNQDCAHALIRRLTTLPYAPRPINTDMQVEIALEAGSIQLNLKEFTDLEENDILLPTEYPAARNEIILRPCARLTAENTWTARCSVQDRRGTVIAVAAALKESDMHATDSADPEISQTSSQSPTHTPTDMVETAVLDTGNIGLTLTFELERRMIPLRELNALTPGYTFPLDCDPLAPVTLRVNGTAVGTGRLVDMDGVLGVQICSLAPAGESDV
jgi:type III secretion protein Q